MSLRKKVISAMICGSIAAFSLVPAARAVNSNIVLAAETYTVSGTVTRFSTADDAAEGLNPVGEYQSGTYYVYKSANGMVNISTNPGIPGSWINPSEGGSFGETEEELSETKTKETETKAEVKETETTPVKEEVKDEVKKEAEAKKEAEPEVSEMRIQAAAAPAAETYTLSSSARVYVTAAEAANGRRSSNIYTSGTYYIYKQSGGMINITKTPGIPGGWINPGEGYKAEQPVSTKTPEATTPSATKPSETSKPAATSTSATSKAPVTAPSDNTNNGATFTLSAAAPKYITAENAASGSSNVGTYAAGTYYIYKSSNGMINITKTPGVPGAWINPGSKTSVPDKTTTTAVSTSAPKATTPKSTSVPESGNTVKLTSETEKYSNAADAKAKTGSLGTYPAGTYYVYKVSGGMVNVTKTPGIPGAWINYNGEGVVTTVPGKPNTGSTQPTSTQKVNRESIADYALQFVGEGGSRFKSWYGIYDEWCAMFVSYVADKTGNKDLIPKIAYVPSYVDLYKKKADLKVNSSYRPEKDMLIVFDYEPNNIANHIGIVTGSDDKYVYTVEGNSSDMVKERKYDINDPDIMGYMMPGYSGATVAGQLVANGAYIKRATR